jgi:glycosyltransferase involved in cell wall biosynthesis
MAALPRILAADPRAVAVVAGENVVAYGGDALRGVDWKARALGANAIDPARLHFVGTLGPEGYRRLLRRSDAHVYLSVPFVLSWSMLEAMSVGCAIVASDTAPIREVADATEVRLVDMRSPEAIADAVIATLGDPTGNRAMRACARARAMGSHQQADCHALKLSLFERLLAENAELPAPTPARARGVRR